MSSLSRRSALRVVGAGGAAAVAAMAGLLPELRVARAAAPFARGVVDRRLVVRHHRDSLPATWAAVDAHPDMAHVRAFLAADDVRTARTEAAAMDVLWNDGEWIGSLAAGVHHDPRSRRYAHVLWQSSAAGVRVGVALWSADSPARRQVFELVGGTFEKSADLTRLEDGSVRVERPGQDTVVVPPHPSRTRSGKKGSAALSAQLVCSTECAWYCTFSCTLICGETLMMTCAMAGWCGPYVAVCSAVCTIAVVITCAWNCGNYCNWSCSTICNYIEQYN